MDVIRTQDAWTSLDTLLTVGTLGALDDGQLLECFRDRRDRAGQEAFRILVERHGPMVLGVCQRLIRDPHEAEDAFQATFLVLVRKAESIRRRDTIGPWLYGVAGRVARRARARANRRHRREVSVAAEIAVEDRPDPEPMVPDQVLHEEIARLPESYRAPVVLCGLQGLTYDLAARRLGISEPTLRGRLHRARKRLGARLQRRGLGAPIVAGVFESGGIPLPALPSSLMESTVQIAWRWPSITGLLVAGTTDAPESIVALAQGVLRTMLFQSLRITGLGALLTVGVVGTVVLAQQGKKGPREPAPRTAEAVVPSSQNRAVPATPARTSAAARSLEEQTRQIKLVLDLPIPMSFPNETPLGDVLKYIKQATTTPTFKGIPIYVEPLGLKEAGKSIRSPVQIDLQDVPLKTSLRAILRQVGQDYVVKEGFLMIDSRMSILERRVEELDGKLDQVLGSLERLGRAR